MTVFEFKTHVLPSGFTGTVYVTALSAVVKSWHERDRGNVDVVIPALKVTTFVTYDESAGVTWRGRTYHLDHVLTYGEPGYSHRGGWGSDHREYHTRGYLSENMTPLDWKSNMRERLASVVDAARDAYVTEFPGWETESKRLRLRSLIRRADDDAAKALKDAEAARVKALRLQAEFDAL